MIGEDEQQRVSSSAQRRPQTEPIYLLSPGMCVLSMKNLQTTAFSALYSRTGGSLLASSTCVQGMECTGISVLFSHCISVGVALHKKAKQMTSICNDNFQMTTKRAQIFLSPSLLGHGRAASCSPESIDIIWYFCPIQHFTFPQKKNSILQW